MYKLEKQPDLKTKYAQVIEEYLHLDHLEKVPQHEINNEGIYLPHFAILRLDKDTSQVRVVFDASCKVKMEFLLMIF